MNELRHGVTAFSEMNKLSIFLTKCVSMKYDDLKAKLKLCVSTYTNDWEASGLDKFLQLRDVSSESEKSSLKVFSSEVKREYFL